MNNYPKVYLVLDNCFALKRWVKPEQWMKVSKEIGFNYIQASTDNEIDPLFSETRYFNQWFKDILYYEKEYDVKVINFFTGYQTYRTVGFAHHDENQVKYLLDRWVKPLMEKIKYIDAKGLGFSFFAMSDEVLQNKQIYNEVSQKLYKYLSELSEFGKKNGGVQISVEQMYAPHQPPFTVDGTKEYIKKCYEIAKNPVYTTIDVGHMVGQKEFLRPTDEELLENLRKSNGMVKTDMWLGADTTYAIWNKAVSSLSQGKHMEGFIDVINKDMNVHKYMFSKEEDCNPYTWLEELACYSPIIHMQQTDGLVANHAAFTPETNKNGMIQGEKLLKAIAKSYEKDHENGMPEKVENIYLSFEIFFSNIERKENIINKLKQTLKYWRQFVPEDGIYLDKLINLMK
jgi:hypothetical protein